MERERASVIMMRGHGEDRLRQAIMQGLVREEISDDVNEVLRQIEDARREVDMLKQQKTELQKELGSFKQIYYDALRATQRTKARKAKWKNIREYGIFIGMIFGIVLLCTIICRAIFG